MFEIGIEGDGEAYVFSELFRYLLLEGIGAIFTIVAFIFIIFSSIKLLRGNNIPGAKLIFYSIIFTFIGTVISVFYALVLNIEENIIIEAIINIFLGVMFLMGSYGFWCLVKFTIKQSANKTLRSTANAPADFIR